VSRHQQNKPEKLCFGTYTLSTFRGRSFLKCQTNKKNTRETANYIAQHIEGTARRAIAPQILLFPQFDQVVLQMTVHAASKANNNQIFTIRAGFAKKNVLLSQLALIERAAKN
jgi:hypothetical protein